MYSVAPRAFSPACSSARISACFSPSYVCDPSPTTEPALSTTTAPTQGFGDVRPTPWRASSKARRRCCSSTEDVVMGSSLFHHLDGKAQQAGNGRTLTWFEVEKDFRARLPPVLRAPRHPLSPLDHVFVLRAQGRMDHQPVRQAGLGEIALV